MCVSNLHDAGVCNSDKGHGAEGVGGVQTLRAVHGTAGTSEEQRGVVVGGGVGAVPVVLPENGELDEGVGEGDGGQAQGDIVVQRRRHAQLRQRTAVGAGGAVLGRERTQGVGGARGARRFDNLRVASTWRQRSQAHTLQVINLFPSSRAVFCDRRHCSSYCCFRCR